MKVEIRAAVHGGPSLRGAAAVFSTALLITFLAGCGARHAATRDALLGRSVPATVSVQTRRVPGLGTVIADADGRTLYMFPPDAGSRVSCTGPCAGTWPALATTSTRPTAGPGVNASVLGELPDPNSGARVVTYAGYPLYRYAGDTMPGTANGQGLFLDSGPWYALTPAGNPITTTPGQAR